MPPLAWQISSSTAAFVCSVLWDNRVGEREQVSGRMGADMYIARGSERKRKEKEHEGKKSEEEREREGGRERETVGKRSHAGVAEG